VLKHAPKCVLITSFDDDQVWEESQQAECKAVLIKPVTASGLYDTLVTVLQGDAPPFPLPVSPSVAEHDLRQFYRGARILVAEDNLINQEVALELLREAGLEADLAQNGIEAVEKVREQNYDLILMDVQMQEMDGLEATRMIRSLPGRQDVPILAMTANAFEEDRQRCLEAGMNDHLGKPVEPARLFAALLKWLDASGAVRRPPDPNLETATTIQALDADQNDRLKEVRGLDVESGLKRFGGRIANYVRTLNKFADSEGAVIALLRGHLDTGNLQQAQRRLYSLRGASVFIGATRLPSLAEELEQALREHCAKPEIERFFAALAAEHTRVIDGIRTLPPALAAAGAPIAPDHTTVKNVLAKLELLLAQDDIRASQLMQESTQLLRAALGDAARVMETQIGGFDYPAALTKLRQARAQLEAAGGPLTGAAMSLPESANQDQQK
jgi:CheY-like chemotaxis protein